MAPDMLAYCSGVPEEALVRRIPARLPPIAVIMDGN
jgi:hypothetical protein